MRDLTHLLSDVDAWTLGSGGVLTHTSGLHVTTWDDRNLFTVLLRPPRYVECWTEAYGPRKVILDSECYKQFWRTHELKMQEWCKTRQDQKECLVSLIHSEAQKCSL